MCNNNLIDVDVIVEIIAETIERILLAPKMYSCKNGKGL